MVSRSEPGCGQMGAGKWAASPILPVNKHHHLVRRWIEGQLPIQDATSPSRQPTASSALPKAGLDSSGGRAVWAYLVNNNATRLPCQAMSAICPAAATWARWEKPTIRSERKKQPRSQHKCR